MKKVIFLTTWLIMGGSAQAASITCVFSDEEQTALRRVIEVLTGSMKEPAGGIINAGVGVFLTNKLGGALAGPAAPSNCYPTPPKVEREGEPVKPPPELAPKGE